MSKNYPFDIMCQDADAAIIALKKRPFNTGFANDASRFIANDALLEAINTALAVGEPLLLTGEAGTGKTQAAYYVAWKLKLGEVLHYQVKSDSSAQDLLYHFDSVRYFHDAHMAGKTLDKKDYVEKRPLWQALAADQPRVLLIDEIDKAPRDFPNDLLFELDQMAFTVKETGEELKAQKHNRPLIFITSNSERRLPEPFLRRCVFHHIGFDQALLEQVVISYSDEFANLSNDFVKLAINRFLALRRDRLRKLPATGELLIWLRVMALAAGTSESKLRLLFDKLKDNQKVPPYLGTLLKDRQDIEAIHQRYK